MPENADEAASEIADAVSELEDIGDQVADGDFADAQSNLARVIEDLTALRVWLAEQGTNQGDAEVV